MRETIAWFSGGITSAVACKIALEKYDCRLVYIETGNHHPDHARFKTDCEKWFDQEIETIKSDKFEDIYDVFEKLRFINSPYGAPCTKHLKKLVREKFEKNNPHFIRQVWGFDYSQKEIIRKDRIVEKYQKYKHYFPLIESQITKKQAFDFLAEAKIKIPAMYSLGYHNSNCIGCVKGGMAYWNKIRVDFPDIFEKTAKIERKIGRSSIKNVFLDELKPDQGKGKRPLVMDCGHVGEGCELQLSIEYHHSEV